MAQLNGPRNGCDAVGGLLSPFLDGELEPARAESVGKHLGSCASCRREWERLKGISRWVREKGREGPAPPAWETVEARVRTRRRARAVWRRTAAVAAALLAAAVGFFLVQSTSPEGAIPLPRVAGAEGAVELARAGSDAWVAVRSLQPLGPGDRVRTAEGTARVDFEGATAYLDRRTEILVAPEVSNGSPAVSVELGGGEIYVEDYGRRTLVRTPGGVFEPIGTRFAVRRTSEGTRVAVEEGEVRARAASGPVTVEAGRQAEVARDSVTLGQSKGDLAWARKAAEKLGGYVLLFNGKDLSGWTPSPSSSAWPVRDGTLVAVPMTQLHFDRQDLQDGELYLEFRATIPDPRRMNSMFKFGKDGAVLNLHSDGRILLFGGLAEGDPGSRVAHVEGKNFLDGSWHRARMRFAGRGVSVEIDGAPILSGELPKGRDPGRIYLRLRSSERGFGEFRNIRFRPEKDWGR